MTHFALCRFMVSCSMAVPCALLRHDATGWVADRSARQRVCKTCRRFVWRKRSKFCMSSLARGGAHNRLVQDFTLTESQTHCTADGSTSESDNATTQINHDPCASARNHCAVLLSESILSLEGHHYPRAELPQVTAHVVAFVLLQVAHTDHSSASCLYSSFVASAMASSAQRLHRHRPRNDFPCSFALHSSHSATSS